MDQVTQMVVERLDRIEGKVDAHGTTLSAIDERTQGQEKRIDRMDRRSASISTVMGAIAGALAYVGQAFGFGR